MTDFADLRRRAAQHAGYGHYRAGKCLGLIDRLRTAERERDEARHALALAADPEFAETVAADTQPGSERGITHDEFLARYRTDSQPPTGEQK